MVPCSIASIPAQRSKTSKITPGCWRIGSMLCLYLAKYAYGVAFQLTGNPKYLKYAKAGVDYLRRSAFDRQHGGAYSFWDGASQSWGPALQLRNPQEQAYALLGISYYYYLTRDPDILPDILATKNFIFKTYYNPRLNLLQWQLEDGNDGKALDKHLTAQLDQLNAYMLLLTPILPEPHQTEWKQDMVRLVKSILSQFYSPQENLFFLLANSLRDRDAQKTGIDFGHTSKAMWMIRMVGLLTKDESLVTFVNNFGPQVLERAYLPESGSWSNGIKPGRIIDRNKDWWVYAELNQFAASLALERPSLTAYLSQTYQYWFNYFVDRKYGEVWTTIDAGTNQPLGDLLKQWSWKNGYHSFEHALVGYITASQLHQERVVLYYAFKQKPSMNTVHPYFYRGKIDEIKQIDDREIGTIYKITFSRIK
jgi:mannose/cellobiose epimerase-like protein (N-acyl-D-glucosamine 2-epimerase family)